MTKPNLYREIEKARSDKEITDGILDMFDKIVKRGKFKDEDNKKKIGLLRNKLHIQLKDIK